MGRRHTASMLDHVKTLDNLTRESYEMMMSRAGRLLHIEGLVSQTQLEEAARQQSLDGGTIGLHLVRAGVVREGALTEIFCQHLGLEEATADELEGITAEVAGALEPDLTVGSRVVPLELLGDDWLSVGMTDPTDDKTVAEVARQSGRRLILKVIPETEASLTLERIYGTSRPADLPSWSSARDSDPTPSDVLSESDEFDIDIEEGSATTSRRFRAPVVLEGKYDKISPDELPPDADAGYIPLTQVKRRPPGPKASDPVIHVQSVDVGPRPEIATPVPDEPSPGPQEREPVAPGTPLHEEILETLQGVVPLENVKSSPPPQPADEKTAMGPLDIPPPPHRYEAPTERDLPSSRPPTPAPQPTARHRSSSQPPPAQASATPRELPSNGPPSPKPEPYAGVPGGETWEYYDDADDGRQTALEVERPEDQRKRSRRDTLIDLPKIDAANWAGQSELSIDELLEGLEHVASRDEAIQLSLSYMASICRRAAFFVLKRGVVEGFDALGPNLSLEQVRSIWIPLSSRSTLCEAVASKSIRTGPIGDSRTDAIFCAALGGRRGDSIIVPIKLGSRVVSVLYGDDLRESAPTLEHLESVADGLSRTLARLLIREKHRGSP